MRTSWKGGVGLRGRGRGRDGVDGVQVSGVQMILVRIRKGKGEEREKMYRKLYSKDYMLLGIAKIRWAVYMLLL